MIESMPSDNWGWDLRGDGTDGVGFALLADDLLKIETTAADGTRTISTDNWADRLVHYEMAIGYNPAGNAPAPASSLLLTEAVRIYHGTFLLGSSYGSTWQTITQFLAGGGTLQFQAQGSTGTLRWNWANASSWPGDTWYRIRVWSTDAKTAYDYIAT